MNSSSEIKEQSDTKLLFDDFLYICCSKRKHIVSLYRLYVYYNYQMYYTETHSYFIIENIHDLKSIIKYLYEKYPCC